jgi:hypothetical protein
MHGGSKIATKLQIFWEFLGFCRCGGYMHIRFAAGGWDKKRLQILARIR